MGLKSKDIALADCPHREAAQARAEERLRYSDLNKFKTGLAVADLIQKAKEKMEPAQWVAPELFRAIRAHYRAAVAAKQVIIPLADGNTLTIKMRPESNVQ